MLVGNVSFHADYQKVSNGSKKLLLVEGQTDKKFIEKILRDDVVCIVANKAFGNKNSYEKESFNCKEAIEKTLYGIKRIPMLVKCPSGAEKWDLYGMIDRDEGIEREFEQVHGLFVTDTRDLETQIISTDRKVFNRISICKISHIEVMTSLLISYQLAVMKEVIRHDVKDKLSLACINTGSKEVEMEKFIDVDHVNINKLVEYILDSSNVSTSCKRKVIEQILASKRYKKEADASFAWKKKMETFDPDNISDFWQIINGHDVLETIRYISKDAGRAFGNTSSSLNREFEFELVDKYDHSNLAKTKLYEEMSKCSLVKS